MHKRKRLQKNDEPLPFVYNERNIKSKRLQKNERNTGMIKSTRQNLKSSTFGTKCVIFLLALSLLILILFISLMSTALDINCYKTQFILNDADFATETDMSELDRVIEQMISFLAGKSSSPQISAIIDGKIRPAYDSNELSHLLDVGVMFDKGRGLATLALVVFIACILHLVLVRNNSGDIKRISARINKLKNKQNLYIAPDNFGLNTGYASDRNALSLQLNTTFFKRCIYGVIILIVALLAICAIDFNTAFNFFHETFFPQGNWSFPPTSFMINMLEINLFINFTVLILLKMVCSILICILICNTVLIYSNKKFLA